jgi:site-specific DNA recombinase
MSKLPLKHRALAVLPNASAPMLSCAIYARKSTADDRDRNAENKSTAHQISKVKAYAASKGWRINDEHVYVDDGISGAEYVARPGLARLIAALPKRGKPPFDVLLMTESSRLGRDMTRNAAFVVDIIESGVRIFYCLTDEEERADTPEQKFMLTARSYASEVERIKTGQRTRNVLESKAKRGFCAGGACFGYSTVEVMGKNSAGEDVRSHVDYAINEQEASVVRHIFRMYLAGFGHSSIAKTMNGDPAYRAENRKFFGGRMPPGPRTGTGSWAPSSIRAMLYNERYTGKVPYGRLRRVYRGGTQTRVVAGKPTFADRPDLRIISEELWSAVQKRLKAVKNYYVREQGGTLWGRPEIGRESK